MQTTIKTNAHQESHILTSVKAIQTSDSSFPPAQMLQVIFDDDTKENIGM